VRTKEGRFIWTDGEGNLTRPMSPSDQLPQYFLRGWDSSTKANRRRLEVSNDLEPYLKAQGLIEKASEVDLSDPEHPRLIFIDNSSKLLNATEIPSARGAAQSAQQPYVPVTLPVSDEDTRMVGPASWGRRAIFKVAQDRGIPEDFTREWMDHQQANGKLKTYDLQSRSPFGDTNELLKATGYDPNTKSLTLHVRPRFQSRTGPLTHTCL
jgi:hypothetical protein